MVHVIMQKLFPKYQIIPGRSWEICCEIFPYSESKKKSHGKQEADVPKTWKTW